jgi:hypothetical protein
VKLTAIDLDYTRGWEHLGQRGTQHLQQRIELVARLLEANTEAEARPPRAGKRCFHTVTSLA